MADFAITTGAEARPEHSPIPTRRQKIEAEIERLIGLLDAWDGDPDLEDGADDEPSLGSTPWRGMYDLEADPADSAA